MEQVDDLSTRRKSSLKRELGLTGDIEVDVERFGKNGRKISEIHKRNQTLEKIQSVVMDIALPACDNVTDVIMVVGLYTMPSYRVFSYWTMGLLYLPTVFLVIHYLLNFTKRHRWYAELPFLIFFGPTVDWVIYLVRLVKGEKANQVDKEVDKFLYIAKIVNGVIEASLQLIWTILLITIKVKPLPWTDMTNIPDLVGNSVPIPASTLSIIFSAISIIKSLAYFWNRYGVVRNDGSLPEDNSCSFLVLPILATSMIFRLGCLVMFTVYLNIYTMAVLGLSLVAFNIIRLFRTCFEESCALGETVSGFANSILPTPSSSDQRSHNLYLLHDLVTSSLYLCFLIIIQVLNLNYSHPFYKRLDNLIIGHTEFLVMIGIIIAIIATNCILRFIFQFVNRNSTKKNTAAKKSKTARLNLKLTKILMIKAAAALVLALLMASSVALIIVSAIVTTKNAEDSTDITGSNCLVKFEPGMDFLTINSISCDSVSKIVYNSPKDILNDTQCYSNIRNDDVENLVATSRMFYGSNLLLEFEYDFEDLDIKNQTSLSEQNPALPAGFGKLENIIFIAIMVLIALALAVVLLVCKKPARKTKKPLPEKISLHSTKRPNCRENLTERTL